MLTELAGPIAISSHLAADGNFAADQHNAVWVDGWGLLCLNDDPDDYDRLGVWCIKPNGKATYLAGAWGDSVVGFGWNAVLDCLVVMREGGGHWHNATIPAMGQLNGCPRTVGPSGRNIGVLDTQVIYGGGIAAEIYAAPLGSASSSEIYEAVPWAVGGDQAIHYFGKVGGEHIWWLASQDTGYVWKYNSTTNTKVVGSETTFGSTFTCCGYSRAWGLWFVTRNNGTELYIYSTEPEATAISNPALSGLCAKGTSRIVTATVTGAGGEKCPGRNVTFTTTHGTVDPVTVETDEDGIAASTFHAPATTVVGGTLTATLTE